MFDAIDACDWRRLQRYLHPDLTYFRPGYPPFVGLQRVLAFYEHERVIASGKHALRSVISNDTAGACCGCFVGVHKNGARLEEQFADVYEFDGSLIVRRQSFFFRPAV